MTPAQQHLLKLFSYNNTEAYALEIQAVLTRYFQGRHSREGNGIGLSIVRAIMESMHQRYGVQNYDNGVAFWFELDARSDVGR